MQTLSATTRPNLTRPARKALIENAIDAALFAGETNAAAQVERFSAQFSVAPADLIKIEKKATSELRVIRAAISRARNLGLVVAA